MPLEERPAKILGFLAEREVASVAELSELFEVSPVTIRSDLNQLAELGRVIRTHGGARISSGRTRQELSFASRQRTNADQKRLIGFLAAQRVEPGDAILLDASTTAVAMAHALKLRNDLADVTVVTTGIFTALELLGNDAFSVVLSGGYVRSVTGSITGLITNDVLDRFNFDKVFLGAWGITLESGLMDSSLVEVELKQTIVPRCQDLNAILDGSKFGRTGIASFASIADLSRIITDSSAPLSMIDLLRDQGVAVLITSDRTEDGNE
jgi:DeoR/GlpR family transcriptional regulator of sugar metabolism